MTTPTPSKAAEFVASVLRLDPKLAVFDCDGTLWAGDAGEGFFHWELKRGVLSNEIANWAGLRYADYKAGNVAEDTMCGEMVTMHRGLLEAELERVANQFFEENFVARIFPEMQDLVRRLQDQGCEIWAVSSTNEWVIRAATLHFGIDPKKILAASAEIEDGRITDKLVRVPSGEGKPKAIREVIGKIPDAAFGNSRWDADMLQQAQRAFAVNPNPDLEKVANERGWTVYRPWKEV